MLAPLHFNCYIKVVLALLMEDAQDVLGMDVCHFRRHSLLWKSNSASKILVAFEVLYMDKSDHTHLYKKSISLTVALFEVTCFLGLLGD